VEVTQLQTGAGVAQGDMKNLGLSSLIIWHLDS
jgi:hypothetical protein